MILVVSLTVVAITWLVERELELQAMARGAVGQYKRDRDGRPR
jgi:hypothetical protein